MINTIRRAAYWAGLVVIAVLNRRESFAEFVARHVPHAGEAPAQWQAKRLWRAVGPDGDLWAESSDEAEVRERARPGDTIQRFYVTEPRGEWRNA